MPIENFQLEKEQENFPVNLISRENREEFMRNSNVGDIIWVSLVYKGYGKTSRLKKYVKPFMSTIKQLEKEKNYIQFDWDNTKSGGRRNSGYEYYTIVHTTEAGCKYLHDQAILEIARNQPFSGKQSLYKKLLITPPPTDQLMIDALNWKDNLTDLEKSFIEKLIEISK